MHLRRSIALCLLLSVAVPARAEPSYEEPPVLAASGILEPAELRGPYHRVRDRVEVRDYLMVFEIESDYGLLTAHSRRLLRTRLHEIEVLATVGRSSRAGEVFRGLENSLRRSGSEAVPAIRDPFVVARRTPQAAWSPTLGRVEGALGDSAYEGSWAVDAVYGEPKRTIAGELGLDPYSTNPAVQQVLDQLARARAGGGWSVDLSGLPLPDAVGWSRSALDARAAVREAVVGNAPDDVDRLNDGRLRALGVSTYARRRFEACPWLSPTHKTVIAGAAARLRGVDDLEALLVAAAEATDEARAVVQAVQATMLAAFHAKQGSLRRLDALGGVVVAYAEGGHVIVALPIDHGTFDAHIEAAMRGVLAMPAVRDAPSRTVYLTGRASPALASFLEGMGIRLFQGVTLPTAP